MDIREKIYMDYNDFIKNGPINIVALGDSVTHGALAQNEIDYETVYHNRLRKKINALRIGIPVNVINAGIGGTTALDAVKRMDTQVFSHNPDLVIICFGLNDVNGSLENYLNSLRKIFEKCNENKIEAIFMTPNMLNSFVAEDTAPELIDYAKKTAQMQNEGKMDTFIYSAVDLAKQLNIKVCDCYSKWKEIEREQATTLLLANRINHPTREMHELFAQMLFECIFPDKAV